MRDYTGRMMMIMLYSARRSCQCIYIIYETLREMNRKLVFAEHVYIFEIVILDIRWELYFRRS